MKKTLLYLFTLIFAASAITALAETTDGETEEATVTPTLLNTTAVEDTTKPVESISNGTDDTEEEGEAELYTEDGAIDEGEDTDFEVTPGTNNADAATLQKKKELLLQQKKEAAQNQIAEKEALIQQKKEAVQNQFADKEELIQQRKEELEQHREEFRNRLTEKKKAIVSAYEERMVNRLHAALDRLELLADRIGSRIEKVNDQVDTAKALILIEEAKEKIGVLRTEVDNINTEIESLYDSDNPKTIFEEVRAKIKKIVEGIKEIHHLLVDAIKSLKAGIENETPEPDDGSDEDTSDGSDEDSAE